MPGANSAPCSVCWVAERLRTCTGPRIGVWDPPERGIRSSLLWEPSMRGKESKRSKFGTQSGEVGTNRE
eukprot:366111-Chlamydomonas_euryale.AAC.9